MSTRDDKDFREEPSRQDAGATGSGDYAAPGREYDRPQKDDGHPQNKPDQMKADPGQGEQGFTTGQGPKDNPQIDPQRGNRTEPEQPSRGSSSNGDSWGEKDPSQRV